LPKQEVGEIRRMEKNSYDDGGTHARGRELFKSGIPLPRFQKTYLAAPQYVDGSEKVPQNTGYGAERRALTRSGTAEHCYVGAVTMQDMEVPTHNSGEARQVLALGPGEVSYVGAVAVQDMEVHTHNSGEERDVLAFGPGEMMYARAANSAPGTDSTDTAQDTVGLTLMDEKLPQRVRKSRKTPESGAF
jgi:hypothetical protein